jgi:hypothetical protein
VESSFAGFRSAIAPPTFLRARVSRNGQADDQGADYHEF